MKMNKKGFTIVELVIVIAVIAILAGVLIPTFSGIVKKAQDSALQQEATALYKEAYALDLSDGKIDGKDKDTAITTVEGTAVKYAIVSNKATFGFCKNDKIAKFDGAKWTIAEHKAANHVNTATPADTLCDECGVCYEHVDEKNDAGESGTNNKCDVCGADVTPAQP